MKCKGIKTKLVQYNDNALPDPQSQQVRNHMEKCSSCSNLNRQFKKLNQMIADAAPVVPKIDLTMSIMNQIRLQARIRFRSMFKDVVAAAVAAIFLFWVSAPLFNDFQVPRYSNEVIKMSGTVGGVFKTYLSLTTTVSDKFSASMKEMIPQVKKGEDEIEL